MAASFLSPISSATTHRSPETLEFIVSNCLPKSSFLFGTSRFSVSTSLFSSTHHGKLGVSNKFKRCAQKSPHDNIPKQFRQENLKEGLMENFRNVPQYLYGLAPGQMDTFVTDMFMTETNPVRRQSESATEESISCARSYLGNGGTSMSDAGLSKYSMNVSMYHGGARSRPPDLPSWLLDSRIVFLGNPISPEVTKLIVSQLMFLDYENSTKPIYLYINSPGTQNLLMGSVGAETDAYAIADCMAYSKAKVYTVNCAMAFGQAAMLFSRGAKGYRALHPNAATKLYLPTVYRSSGVATDMWIMAKDLEANTEYYIELLAEGIGKPKEEIAEDLKLPKLMLGQEAIDYGIADKIINPKETMYEKRNYAESLAKSKVMRAAAPRKGKPFNFM